VVRGTRRRWRTRVLAGAAAALALIAGATVVTAWAGTGEPARYSFFTGADTSSAVLDPDRRSVEVGLRFTTSVGGSIEAVRFLKAPGDTGTHRVSVWSSDGQRAASATSSGETQSGWQQVTLAKAVSVKAGHTYTVSYHTTRYLATTGYFKKPTVAGPLTATGPHNGVYAYGADRYPDRTYHASNYWVDLVFAAKASPGPSPSASPSASPSGSSSGSPSASPSPTGGATGSPTSPGPTGTPPPGGLDLATEPWEGGPQYYAQWSWTRDWASPNFFPVGVWLESVIEPGDVATDKAAGLNTYVGLTANSNPALVLQAGGMYVLEGDLAGQGTETVGHLLTDEADMNYGPGTDGWNGKDGWGNCIPSDGHCGYTVMQTLNDRTPNDGRLRYANYGKGVQFWESDDEAQRFVNQYQQVVSSDLYFYTDPNLCPEEGQRYLGLTAANCRRSASYGLAIDRLRKLDGLDGKRIPVYGFVEVGHPATENDAPTIAPGQIAGAVMNSLIHGARGIFYFNHSFGGPCQSQHLLRDSCGAAARPTVTETNRRIATLAPVLNSPTYQWTANPGLDTMLKAYDGSVYLFAMPGQDGGTGSQTLTLPATVKGGTAEVLFEDRTVPVSGGKLTDTFAAEYQYHIYRISMT
jgi:hypothetical protein